MKIGILTFADFHGRDEKTIGSSTIRSKWLLNHWVEAERFKVGVKYDAVIFQKAYFADYFKYYNGIKILDLCDPDWFDSSLELKKVSNYIDAFTCATESIAKFVKSVVDKPVYYVPDRIDIDLISKDKKHTERAKEACWFGYWHNAEKVLPMVLYVLSHNKIKLRVISNNPFDPLNNFAVEIINNQWDEEAFRNISQSDFVLNPVLTYGKWKYKSNNKTLISWALGLPVANCEEDIIRFLDPKEREKEVALRKKELKEKWDIKLSVKEMQDIINNIKK